MVISSANVIFARLRQKMMKHTIEKNIKIAKDESNAAPFAGKGGHKNLSFIEIVSFETI